MSPLHKQIQINASFSDQVPLSGQSNWE